MRARPAYLPIAAALLATGAATLGIIGIMDDADSLELLGLSIVLAILGLRE